MDKQMLLWIQNGNVVKGEIDFDEGTATFYDKFDNIVLKRKGLTHKQLMEIKCQIQKQLATRKRVGFYYV
jgi:hypothetical protein